MPSLRSNKQRGFALYYAILFSSMLLVMSVTILNVTMKEFLITGSLIDSDAAYYAADSGMQCARYWDYSPNSGGDSFPTTTPATAYSANRLSFVSCGGGAITITQNVTEPDCPAVLVNAVVTPQVVTELKYNLNNQAGVLVHICKVPIQSGVIKTTIKTYGQNTPNGATSNKTVQRGLMAVY